MIGLAQSEAFLADYAELIRKHGIAIWACGCCNSPRLHKLKPGDDPGCYISELREEKEEEEEEEEEE